MKKVCGYKCHNNVLVLLLTALLFASVIVNSECRLITSKHVEEEEEEEKEGYDDGDFDEGMMSRDEMVQVAGYGENKLSTVLITGTLICNNPCFAAKPPAIHHQLMLPSHPISGAVVEATCEMNRKDNWAKTVTDKYGEFIIDLPSHLHSIPNLEKVCSVTILELPKESPCHQSNIVKEIKLASVGNGIRTYTTGTMASQQTLPKNSEACVMKELKDEQEMSW